MCLIFPLHTDSEFIGLILVLKDLKKYFILLHAHLIITVGAIYNFSAGGLRARCSFMQLV
ncbi:hypothetical protein MtrunA17_Chr5g0428911 [Medicago truncatula]|uniref:Transmembrane protein n=1 Tax=Medicago truncatula TaxID=3880 RepID=A0A396HV45_MEDTR|nr:hypothetical protein MtrunA17_Chr5g0428911 [Medicago truncatula]